MDQLRESDQGTIGRQKRAAGDLEMPGTMTCEWLMDRQQRRVNECQQDIEILSANVLNKRGINCPCRAGVS